MVMVMPPAAAASGRSHCHSVLSWPVNHIDFFVELEREASERLEVSDMAMWSGLFISGHRPLGPRLNGGWRRETWSCVYRG
jgi:hypothetical protein